MLSDVRSELRRKPLPEDEMSEKRSISAHTATLLQQTAFARGRCASLHELDLDDRELPCVECRQRGAEVYSLAAAPEANKEN